MALDTETSLQVEEVKQLAFDLLMRAMDSDDDELRAKLRKLHEK
jgi:SOS response regulatory protein OraA/RecX